MNSKKKSSKELRQDYEYLKQLLEFHIQYKVMDMKSKEWESYQNAALEWMLEIREELERRGENIEK